MYQQAVSNLVKRTILKIDLTQNNADGNVSNLVKRTILKIVKEWQYLVILSVT